MTQARPETAGAWMWRRPETGLRGASGRAARPAMGVGLSLNTRYYSTGLGGCQKGPNVWGANVSDLSESLPVAGHRRLNPRCGGCSPCPFGCSPSLLGCSPATRQRKPGRRQAKTAVVAGFCCPRSAVRQRPASESRAGDKRGPPLWRVLAFPAWLFASDPPANTGQAPGEDRRCGGFPPSPLGHSPAARQRTPSVRQRPASERRAGARRRPPLWRVSAFPVLPFASNPPANAAGLQETPASGWFASTNPGLPPNCGPSR